MATQTAVTPKIKGGSFLIEDRAPADVFTPEDFTEEHRQIAQTTDEFFENEVLPNLERIEHKDFALTRSLLKKAGELGLLSIDIPEKYGGMELDKVSSMIAAEHISKNGSFAGAFGAHAGIGTNPIIYFGTEEQKQKYLPRMATAEIVGAYALTEAHAGSDALAARTRAEKTADGKHYVLNGEKMWITNGGFADIYTVFAKVDGEKFTAFLVEKAFGGITPGPEEKKMGISGSSTTPLIMSDCKVPVENVLHEVGRGHVVAFNILNMGRLKLGAAATGGSKQLMIACARYAKERKAFGKSIGDFGMIQHKLAQMAVLTYGTESILYRTTGLIDALHGESDHDPASALKSIEEYAIECAINKVYGTEALDYVVDEAVQIYGGYGYHQDYPPERAYRDSRINRIFEGTNEINRLLITGMLLKRAQSGHLPIVQATQRVLSDLMSGTGGGDDVVGNIKKMALFTAGVAFQKYMQALQEQQEVLAGITNIIMQAFVAESAQLRTRKMARKSEQAEDMTRVIIHDALVTAENEAKVVLAACADGDTLRTQLAMLRRLAKQEPVNTIALRRRIASRVLEAERHVV